MLALWVLPMETTAGLCGSEWQLKHQPLRTLIIAGDQLADRDPQRTGNKADA